LVHKKNKFVRSLIPLRRKVQQKKVQERDTRERRVPRKDTRERSSQEKNSVAESDGKEAQRECSERT
jgi:hypothetical protein